MLPAPVNPVQESPEAAWWSEKVHRSCFSISNFFYFITGERDPKPVYCQPLCGSTPRAIPQFRAAVAPTETCDLASIELTHYPNSQCACTVVGTTESSVCSQWNVPTLFRVDNRFWEARGGGSEDSVWKLFPEPPSVRPVRAVQETWAIDNIDIRGLPGWSTNIVKGLVYYFMPVTEHWWEFQNNIIMTIFCLFI